MMDKSSACIEDKLFLGTAKESDCNVTECTGEWAQLPLLTSHRPCILPVATLQVTASSTVARTSPSIKMASASTFRRAYY